MAMDITQQGLRNFPAKYFRFIVKEMKERIKICEEISNNMDDSAEIECAFEKSLVKVNSADKYFCVSNINLLFDR